MIIGTQSHILMTDYNSYKVFRIKCFQTVELLFIAYRCAIRKKAGLMGSFGAHFASLSISKCELLNTMVPNARTELNQLLPEELAKVARIWFIGMHPDIRASCKPAMLDVDSDAFRAPSEVCLPSQDVQKQVIVSFFVYLAFSCHYSFPFLLYGRRKRITFASLSSMTD